MNLVKKIKFLIIFFFLFIYSVNSFSLEPKDFIQSVVDEASQVLNSSSTKEEKVKNLKSIAKKNVDIRGIGFYSLGSHRKKLSDDKKKEYIDVFEKYFLKSFSSRLTDYTDPKINVISSEKKSEKYTIVSSILLATEKRPEVKIDWRVYTVDPSKPLIRDLIIEGLSLARTQKEEFASIIESDNQNMNKLFFTLKEFIAK